MSTFKTFLTLTCVSVATFAATGCGPNDDDACSGGKCDSSTLAGTPRALRADGTVDITVDEAWPNRPDEAAPLTPSEVAGACALIAACIDTECGTDQQCEAAARLQTMQFCVAPEIWAFWEERAVPTVDKNERWTFEAREILQSGADCHKVLAAGTDRRHEIVCEEAGCWWQSFNYPIPTVKCDGDVAHLTTDGLTFSRDCSRALQKCDEESPTGCTDRAPVACEHPAKDRCDGDVRLGCDGNGRVSFHDCGRIAGATCGERDDGSIGCLYADAGDCESGATVCNGDAAQVCLGGAVVDLDCKGLGFTGCDGGLCVK